MSKKNIPAQSRKFEKIYRNILLRDLREAMKALKEWEQEKEGKAHYKVNRALRRAANRLYELNKSGHFTGCADKPRKSKKARQKELLEAMQKAAAEGDTELSKKLVAEFLELSE